LNSPIRYYGGKGGMKNSIIKYFPETSQYQTYGEFFGGGASLLFEKEPSPIEIYNDLEENVYSLFKVLSDKDLFSEFKKKADLSYFSRQIRDEFEQELKTEGLSILERAFKFWYVNRTSYSGSGGFSVNTSIRRGMSKSTSDFLSTIDCLDKIHSRLSRVVIEHRSAFELIEKYDNKDCFFYLDPPYVPETRTPAKYKVDMTSEDHKKLIDILISCKSKIVLSGYDNDIYNKLIENGWEKISFDVNTISNERKPRVKTETLWKNF
jgi:DNA adenine methylase